MRIFQVFLNMIVFTLSQQLLQADSEIPAATNIRSITSGFKFTEGPAYGPDQRLYFSDIPNKRIHVWSQEDEPQVFLAPSGRSNGLMFDAKGRLIICQGGERKVSRMEKDGSLTVLADDYEGKLLNSPNDLWVHPNGAIYFTDPRYGKRDTMEMEVEGVYLIHLDSGTIQRVLDELVRPNGIIGTADAKHLYIADPVAQKTYKFPLKADGTLGPALWSIERGSDGMTLDEHGNLYITDGNIAIFSPDGKLLSEIELPEKPSNVTFGGSDNKTLFVTARTSVYAMDMNVGGMYQATAR